MSEHGAIVTWTRGDAPFIDNRYSRAHTWTFDGGAVVPASASPQVMKAPLSDPAGVDPEEAFVASISSCHMLWFLWEAAARKLVVDSYTDRAVGYLEKNAEGRFAITRVVLRPDIVFKGGAAPDADTLATMHHDAHEKCFIANSVRTAVTVESSG
jgi:organic hydroperoxide reductase OsmC/OhrA